MGKKVLCIHIGAPKTASTLVQTVLESTASHLKQFSVHYDPEQSQKMVDKLVQEFLSDQEVEELKQTITERFLKLEEDTIVLSSEWLIGNPSNSFSDTQMISDRLKDITQNFNVKIIAYTRRQDTFLESFYTHQIKYGFNVSFSEYLDQLDLSGFNWDVILEKYTRNFGHENVYVYPYEIILSDREAYLKTFFGVICPGVSVKTQDIPVMNVSLSKIGADIVKRCHPLFENAEDREFFISLIAQHYSKKPSETFDFLDERKREELIANFSLSNKALFECFIPNFPNIYSSMESLVDSGAFSSHYL